MNSLSHACAPGEIDAVIPVPPVPSLRPGDSVAVFGIGRTGVGVARLLRALGQRPLLLESRQSEDLRLRAVALEQEGLSVRLGVPLALDSLPLPHPAAVVVSPGIPWDHPALAAMRRQGIAVLGEMSLARQASASIPWIGITGTNGKTTVTHLIHHLLQQGGLQAPLCGNVGISAAEVALASLDGSRQPPDWMVVELSSYQIEQSPEVSPAIAVWTTLTPDHLERHGSLDHYRAIKRRLLQNATVAILNADDADLRSRAASWRRATWITTGPADALPPGLRPGLWIERGQVCSTQGPLFAASALAMPGDHNRQNMLLATAVALEVGLQPPAIASALAGFPGVPHRLERICERDGIAWINDSKATNFDAAAVALRALDGPLLLLAGGQAKQGDASGWLEQIKRRAAAVVLYGEARERFAGLLIAAEYRGPVERCEDLGQAVALAAQQARSCACRTVLLSPACASFDQYENFEQRGDHFRQLVHALDTRT